METTRPLPGLSTVAGKPIIARGDGGSLSSDGDLMAVREVEVRLGVAERRAACINDPRAPDRIQHSLADMLRFRLLMIAAGNDADCLRHDPLFKLASARLLTADAVAPGGHPGAARTAPDGARHGVALYCASFRQGWGHCHQPPQHARHRQHLRQQLCFFNAYYGEYGFQPIVVFDGKGRLVAAMLRPATVLAQPKASSIRSINRRSERVE